MISIVSKCCEATTNPIFSEIDDINYFYKSPVYYICSKCGKRCENKLKEPAVVATGSQPLA